MPSRRPPRYRPSTTRPRPRPAVSGALLLALAGTALGLGAGSASGHGSMRDPLSRLQGCYLEGPEHPVSAACKAMVAVGGPAPLYDWMSLRIGDAAGRSRQLIPDGKLCSAGQDAYRGLDLPRADWPATRLAPGADFTFRFSATAAHKGTFQLFLTKPDYDPTKPLTWAILEDRPFLTATDPQPTGGSYLLPGRVPAGRHGRQLIYAIWQRSDSPEAFYSCSDVLLDADSSSGTTPTTGAPATPKPTAMPKPTPTPSPAAKPTTTALAQTGPDRTTALYASIGAALLLSGAIIAAVPVLRRPRHRAR